MYIEACNIQKRALSREHPRYAQSLNNLAALYVDLGQYSQAKSLHIEALEIRKHVLGSLHPDYANSLINLAATYFSMGEYTQAEPLYLEARNIIKPDVLGESPVYATVLNNLATLHEKIGEYDKVEPLFKEALDIQKRVLSSAHPDYANSLHNFAMAYYAMGEDAKAEALSLEAFQVLLSAGTKVVPNLSEAQALNWMSAHRPPLDLIISSRRRLGTASAENTYNLVWQTKALITRMQLGQQVAADATPEAREVFSELRNARLKLARLISATPKPDQRQSAQQKG
jgi:tetratricopeptide (TPR) repeat protein